MPVVGPEADRLALIRRAYYDLVGLPPSQLAVLPGTTHQGVVSTGTALLLAIIPPFLDAPMPDAE